MLSAFPVTRWSSFTQPPTSLFWRTQTHPPRFHVSWKHHQPGAKSASSHLSHSHGFMMQIYLFSVIYEVPEPSSSFAWRQGTRVLYGCFGTPVLPWAPQEVVGTGLWVLISLPLHLKQALNLGRCFSWHFVGRQSCRLRETCHKAGLLCRIKSK